MTKPVRRAGVIGAGVMGSGIMAHFANAGVDVVMLDIVPPALLILAVLGSIFLGVATVTEASGIGVGIQFFPVPPISPPPTNCTVDADCSPPATVCDTDGLVDAINPNALFFQKDNTI